MDPTPSVQGESTSDQPWRWFGALFEAALDAILITDDRARLVDANPATCTLLGYQRPELLKLTAQEVVTESPAAFAERWARFIKAGTMSGEIEVRCKGGATRIIEFRAVAHFVPGLHVASMRDITERKRAEEELRSSGERLRRLSARIDHVVERERTELARELHDQLGQSLTALKMDLSWLNQRLTRSAPPARALTQKTASMSAAVDTIIREVRRISAGLRPIALDRLGLLEAIEWQAEEFERRTGVRCRLDSNATSVDLGGDQATQLFRIVQEALTNTTRHANASRVTIVIRKRRDRVVLEIRDNGRGITDQAIADPSALGIAGMRERALLAGGELSIARAGRKGTVVRVTIPLSGRSKSRGASS